MRIDAAQLLELLTRNEDCLGAVFCSYTFDPVFFEDRVLAGVLRLVSDPIEHAERFSFEARRQLQRVPVACIVDRHARRAGRRLPYDLLEVHQRTFHPKLSLVLYGAFAVLQVGSGNLTPSGWGENAELFFTRELRYDSPSDVSALQSAATFIRRCAAMARTRGTQLDAVLAELDRRLTHTATNSADQAPFTLLHAEDGAGILSQFLGLIPAGAKVQRIGVLVPFYETDDGADGDEAEMFSVLNALADRAPGAVLDIGLRWEAQDDAAPKRLAAELTTKDRFFLQLPSLPQAGAATKPRLRVWRSLGATERVVKLAAEDGLVRHVEREEFEARCGDEPWCFRLLKAPVAQGPGGLVASLSHRVPGLRLWLHPGRALPPGTRPGQVVVRRPLHAKLLTITYKQGQKVRTLALVGSPNATRKALLLTAELANVELAIAFLLDGEHGIDGFCEDLVLVPRELLTLVAPTYPTARPDFSLLIRSAEYDAAERCLVVEWDQQSDLLVPPLPAWRLTYAGEVLEKGTTPPYGTTRRYAPFDLRPDRAELELHFGEESWAVQILVKDLSQLPADKELATLSLREMLALLGGRMTRERLLNVRREKGVAGTEAVLEQIFGEDFNCADVFRAWRRLHQDLSEAVTVHEFDLVLRGRLGVLAVWAALKLAVKTGGLPAGEVWLYGAELAKMLSELPHEVSPAGVAKRELADAVTTQLHADLQTLLPAGRPGWVTPVIKFYGLTDAHS